MCTLLGGGSSGGEKTVVILPETTLMGSEAGMPLLNPLAGTPEVGGTCTVTYNGTDYECKATLTEADGTDSIMLGNSDALGISGRNTEAPFVILLFPEGAEMAEDGTMVYAVVADLTGATSATLSIVEKVKVSGGGIPQADIDAAFAALAEKGVTVPDGATSADLDDLIASIVTGGSSGGGIATGYIIPTEDITGDVDIVHNLGEIPKLAVVYRELSVDGFSSEPIVTKEVAFSQAINNEVKGVGYYYSTDGHKSTITLGVMMSNQAIKLDGSNVGYLNGSCVHSCTETTAKLYPIKNGTKKFAAGNKYRWILMTEAAFNEM